MKKKYRVELSEEERKEIQRKQVEKGISATVRKRCSVLLMADESSGKAATQKEIGKRCGVSELTVHKTVKTYAQEGLAVCLRGHVQKEPSRKPIVTGEAEARIIALACGKPPEGYAKWTVRLLHRKVVELKIVESIGRETVRKVLKKRN